MSNEFFVTFFIPMSDKHEVKLLPAYLELTQYTLMEQD